MERVIGELFEGSGEVAARFLVFPAKAATFPHIGPSVAAAGFLGAALKTVVVRIAWLINAQQLTQIIEMLLGTGPLVEPVVFPQADELFRGHISSSRV